MKRNDTHESKEDWKAVIVSLIDGTIPHLAPSTPAKIRLRLSLFKGEALCARDALTRKRLERELESFLQDSACTRAAAKRHLVPNIKAACECTAKTMRQAVALLKQTGAGVKRKIGAEQANPRNGFAAPDFRRSEHGIAKGRFAPSGQLRSCLLHQLVALQYIETTKYAKHAKGVNSRIVRIRSLGSALT